MRPLREADARRPHRRRRPTSRRRPRRPAAPKGRRGKAATARCARCWKPPRRRSSPTTPLAVAVLDASGLVAPCDVEEFIARSVRRAGRSRPQGSLPDGRRARRHLERAGRRHAIMAFLVDANSGTLRPGRGGAAFPRRDDHDRRPRSSTRRPPTRPWFATSRWRRACASTCAPRSSSWELNFVYEQIELPLVAWCSDAWRPAGSASTWSCCARSQGVHRGSGVARQADPGGRRPRVQGELAPAAPDRALRRAGPHGGEEDQVRATRPTRRASRRSSSSTRSSR
jgi:hypothetical protein